MQFFTLFAAVIAASVTFAGAVPTDQGNQPGWQPNKPDCGDKCGDYGHDGGDHGHDGGNWGHDGGNWGHDGGDHGHDGGDGGHHGGDGGHGDDGKVRVGFSLNLNPGTPLGSLSCSRTFNEKFPQFHTLGDLPTAPFYGEVPGAVDGSGKCGSCWKLQYNDKEPIYMIAVDNAAMFQLGKAGFEKFAGQAGFDKGSVVACKAIEVSPEYCHLPPTKW